MNFHCKILFFGFLIYLNLSTGQRSKREAPPDAPAKIAKSIEGLGRKLMPLLMTAPNENVLFSPTNIAHALALLHMAAQGETLNEINTLMGTPPSFNYSKTDIHSALSAFFTSIITDDKKPVILNVADAIFLQNGFPVKQDYLDNAAKLYQAQIENVDFQQGNGKEAAAKMNQWVSGKTRKRIQHVADSFSPDVQAVIITTLYFNARWSHAFNTYSTKNEKFSSGENQVDVPMMNLVEDLPYVNNPELQFEAIDLAYDASPYALNVILPYQNQTIANLIPKLKDLSIKQIMEKSGEAYLDVKLPKTKFNVAQSLNNALQQVGLPHLFTGANLTDMTDANIRISQISHMAEIEIDERGTIATAATVEYIHTRSMIEHFNAPAPFHVNRPFIINIYNRETSLNLFSGIVCKPQ